MLPRVKIIFENGALGGVAPSADGVVGLVSTAVAVAGKFALATPYTLRKLDDLLALGVTAATTDANAHLYRHVKEFYDEAGIGAKLWIMGFPNTDKPSDLVDQTKDTAKKLILASQGEIRALGVVFKPATGYTPTITNGLDGDVTVAMLKAQTLADWATDTMFAPLFVLLEARGYAGTPTALANLSTNSYNRVGVLLGDTSSGSTGAAIGLLLGRIARIPVQRHIGRVRDTAIKTLMAYVGSVPAELADVETINEKGFITFRTFVGKAGYFFSDDSLATAPSDDYRSIARRSTIDKAARIAYQTMLENVNNEVPITEEGTIVPAIAKSIEAEMIAAIISQMGAEGNLGTDPNNPDDKGVLCEIDLTTNIAATNKLVMSLKVKPYGYAKYIDVKLGFITINQ